MTNDELYTTITGDDLSCMTACPKCKGNGYSYTDCSGPTEGAVTSGPCPDCRWTGNAFREDEKGLKRIEEALQKLPGGAGMWAEIVSTDTWFDYEWPGYRRAIKAWDDRTDQPWQKSLEDHVRNYRSPAPDLKADGGKELKRILTDWSMQKMMLSVLGGTVRYHAIVWSFGCSSDTEADALYDAACAAVEKEEKT